MRRSPAFRLVVAVAVAMLLGACAEGGLGAGAAGDSDEDLTDLSDFTDDFSDFSDFSDLSDFSIPDISDFTDFSDFTEFSDFVTDIDDFSDFFSDFSDFGGGGTPIDELEPTPIPDDTPSNLRALAEDCFDGDMEACDELFFDAPIDSDVEEWANTCGGRFDTSPGFCTSAVDDG